MTTFDEMGSEFQVLLKATTDSIDKLSTNGMRRVLKKFLAHPLEDSIFNLNENKAAEISIYNAALEIQSIKFSMMVESLKQDAEEQRIEEARAARATKQQVPDYIDKPDYVKE